MTASPSGEGSAHSHGRVGHELVPLRRYADLMSNAVIRPRSAEGVKRGATTSFVERDGREPRRGAIHATPAHAQLNTQHIKGVVGLKGIRATTGNVHSLPRSSTSMKPTPSGRRRRAPSTGCADHKRRLGRWPQHRHQQKDSGWLLWFPGAVSGLDEQPDSGHRDRRQSWWRHDRFRHHPDQARIAVFDNDGTLWCEKPMPIEVGFILKHLAAQADREPTLRTQQPWKAAQRVRRGR